MRIYIESYGALIPIGRRLLSKRSIEEAIAELYRQYERQFGESPAFTETYEDRTGGPYLIWNKGRSHPTVEHDSITSAKDEAARLAEKQPGEYFLVMAPIAKCHGELDVEVHWEDD